jgi:riboflavin kinase / FMN adenylyltransferase
MKRLSGQDRIEGALRGGIVALGNFDGFHQGHQAVVGRAVSLAKTGACPIIVATFDPHPVRHFRPETPPFRLTTLDQRERLFAGAGADAMLVFRFDGTLAGMSAERFITDCLIDGIGAAGVVTGDDFTFGKERGGNTDVLATIGMAQGMIVETVQAVGDGGETVSSSRIRDALISGDCATATRLLTRPFAIEGVVQHGDKRGRDLGYPTANIDMGSYLRPRYGIYAVRGRLADGRVLEGAANIGIRPSFDPPKELLEVYFFDLDGDLYGQTIEVELHAHLRDEARFDDLDALKAQMAKDCEAARVRLSATTL